MKHVEIEAKMRLEDRAALERKLGDLGTGRGRMIMETNTFFDAPDGRLRASDQGLRVRVEVIDDAERQVTITHKGPRAHGQFKNRTETEIRVDDADRAAALLEALGYDAGLSFEKRRTRYTLDGCRVELDEVPMLGQFVEIEGPSEDAVDALRRKLGLGDAPLVQSSYIAMLSQYLRDHDLPTRRVGFEAASSATAEQARA